MDLYQSFQCMAEACPDTCCAGWRIVVDRQAYDRFRRLEPQSLREDVLSHIWQEGEQLFFENDELGYCTMLNPDGLCRLQLGTSEKMLCNTCRKYPRLVNICDNTLYASMAASCPVVSGHLLSREFQLVCGRGHMAEKGLSLEELSLTQEAMAVSKEDFGQACRLVGRNEQAALPSDFPLLAKTFLRLGEEIKGIGRHYREGRQILRMLDILEVYQGRISLEEELAVFCREQRESWERLRRNFFPYRVFSRRLEYPAEGARECLCQVQGELLLIRFLAFCCHLKERDADKVNDQEWQCCIRQVYRFCAHGKSCAERVHQSFQEFFVQKLLWWFVLY